MIKPLTLIVVTLAVVGSIVESNDPAYASPPKVTTEVVAKEKVVKQKGRKETLASRSSRGRNLAVVRIPLGKPRYNKIFAQVYIEQNYGWGEKQFKCLDTLWTRESGWNHKADNPNSSAYGIPQALPGHKMSSSGKDWKTNPATQIKWGAKYVKHRYNTPCGALKHFHQKNWY